VQVHQMLVEWDEGIATKDLRLFEEIGIPWSTPYAGINGTDANAQYESTLLFQETTATGWKTWDLSALTQKWVNGSATNYGVILWATNENTDGKDLRFHSSEYSDNSLRPKLEITYSTEAKTVYFLKDHLGSIRAAVLDSIGAPVIGYDDYDPWGYPLALRTKAIPNAYLQGASKIKFTGKERDEEHGLNWDYFGARYYDWVIGRWITLDPRESRDGVFISPYVYSFNNPMRFVDPDGEWPKQIHNKILQKAFTGLLTKQQIRILEGSSARVDEDQSVAGAFKHGMRAPFQSAEHAQLMMELFIETKEKEFLDKGGDEGLADLGEALHSLMDATSPAHEGFQVWYGFETPEDKAASIAHAIRESKITPQQLAQVAKMLRQRYLALLKKKEKQEQEKKRQEEERRKKEEERERREAAKRNRR